MGLLSTILEDPDSELANVVADKLDAVMDEFRAKSRWDEKTAEEKKALVAQILARISGED